MSSSDEQEELPGIFISNQEIPVHFQCRIPREHYGTGFGQANSKKSQNAYKLKRKWQSVHRLIQSGLVESGTPKPKPKKQVAQTDSFDLQSASDGESEDATRVSPVVQAADEADPDGRSIDARLFFGFTGQATPKHLRKTSRTAELQRQAETPLSRFGLAQRNIREPQESQSTTPALRSSSRILRSRSSNHEQEPSLTPSAKRTAVTADAKKKMANTPQTRAVRRRNVIRNAIQELKENDPGNMDTLADSEDSGDCFDAISSDESSSDITEEEEDDDDEEDKYQQRDTSVKRRTSPRKVNENQQRHRFTFVPKNDVDEQSSTEASSDGDDENEDELSEQRRFQKMTAGQRQRHLDSIQLYNNYYDNQVTPSLLKNKKASASKNTVGQLPILEEPQYRQILTKLPVQNRKGKQSLTRFYTAQFPQFFFELSMGFNLLFYGFGSKRQLLLDFAKEYLTDGYQLIINGYSPALSLRQAFSEWTQALFGYTGAQGTLIQQAERFCQFLRESENPPRVYFLVHNLDGPALRLAVAQKALAVLAEMPTVSLLGSVDHLHAFLMWDALQSSRMHFVYHDMATFATYNCETENEVQNALLARLIRMEVVMGHRGAGGVGRASVRGILFVMKSLTETAKGVFRILAREQLVQLGGKLLEDQDEEEDDEYVARDSSRAHQSERSELGLSYQSYFEKCRSAFLTSSDMNFRTQLTEFLDHDIIRRQMTADGEMLHIPLEKEDLAEILGEIGAE